MTHNAALHCIIELPRHSAALILLTGSTVLYCCRACSSTSKPLLWATLQNQVGSLLETLSLKRKLFIWLHNDAGSLSWYLYGSICNLDFKPLRSVGAIALKSLSWWRHICKTEIFFYSLEPWRFACMNEPCGSPMPLFSSPLRFSTDARVGKHQGS